MIELIEELKEKNKIYLLLDTTKDFIFAEYKVDFVDFKGINKYESQITFIKANKKNRYFKKNYMLVGYRFKIENREKTYLVYDDYNDMIKCLCKKMRNHVDENPKLFKKLKNKYPEHIRTSTY